MTTIYPFTIRFDIEIGKFLTIKKQPCVFISGLYKYCTDTG